MLLQFASSLGALKVWPPVSLEETVEEGSLLWISAAVCSAQSCGCSDHWSLDAGCRCGWAQARMKDDAYSDAQK